MELALEIARIVLPIAIIGGMAVFVIKGMQRISKSSSLDEENSKGATNFVNSLLPIGMLIGCVVGILISIFTSISLLSAIVFCTAIGYFLGYVAYVIYKKREMMPSILISLGSIVILYLIGWIFEIDSLIFKISPAQTEIALLPIVIGLVLAFMMDKIAESKAIESNN